jgi:nucleotide-binding universal stress UspA family protein
MKILLAIDNSEHSRVPVDFLLMRDWPQDCQITVLSTVDNAKSVAEAEGFIAPVCERIRQTIKHATVRSAVIVGDPKDVIIEQSSAELTDLVILGARGHRGLQRVFLGSVSQHVLNYGPCNTLIVRHEEKTTSGHVERVLLALDKSFHSKRAFEWLLNLPWAAGTEVKLLSVLPPAVDKYSDGFSAIYTDNVYVERANAKNVLEQYLAECANTLKQKFESMNVSTGLLEGDPSEQILQEASAWRAGMILMGSRGHGGIAKFWLGSISQSVVLEAPCPVEVIKAQG